MELTKMRVDAIVVRDRVRRDLGDIEGLASSIATVGLLHPPVVTPRGDLVAGARRLAAVKSLGWKEVPVRVLDLTDTRLAEAVENAERKSLVASEMGDMAMALIAAERDAAKTRQGSRTDLGTNEPNEFGRVRDRIAKFLGVSGRTVAKILALADAAKRDPSLKVFLAEADATGSIDAAYRRLRDHEDEKEGGRLAAAVGSVAAASAAPTPLEVPTAKAEGHDQQRLIGQLAMELRTVSERFLAAHKLQPHQLSDLNVAVLAVVVKDLRSHIVELEDRIVMLEVSVYEQEDG